MPLDSKSQSPSWVIVQTRTDETSAHSLHKTGYRTYLPLYRKALGETRHRGSIMRPLFGGIVFVQDWHGWPKQTILGALGLMRCGTNNVHLDDSDIAILQQRERSGEFDDPMHHATRSRRPDLAEGQDIAIDLLGNRILAVIEDLSENGRAIVRNLLGIRMTVEQSDILVLDTPAQIVKHASSHGSSGFAAQAGFRP